MSTTQSKKSKRNSFISMFFQKVPSKPQNTVQLKVRTKIIDIKWATKMTQFEDEILRNYLSGESIMTSVQSLKHINELNNKHIKRLAQDESCIKDLKSMVIDHSDSLLFSVLIRWANYTKDSIENLNEALELFCAENVEPNACFHLNRSIIHLINMYETISEISRIPLELYDIEMSTFINILVKCISCFVADFIKYFREIGIYLSELKQTLTLLVDRHPENRLVIHAMGDIEKLYSCSFQLISTINTSTPIGLESAIGFIDKISNDINDIKTDLINVKHHQDKDKMYVNSTYV